MILGRSHSGRNGEKVITDAVNSDPQKLSDEAGHIGGAFIAAVDKAVHLQAGSIKAYVNWLRRHNPDDTPAQVQARMDRHFRTTVSGTGAGAGMAAAIPGIGLVTGAAAVAGESVVFLDLAAFYTVASAYLRGVNIDDPERRRAIVLVTLSGSHELAIVDTLLGPSAGPINVNTLSRFSGPRLTEINGILTRTALRSLTKRIRRAWLGKLLPMGIGAVAGTVANRKLSHMVTDNIANSFGPLPDHFVRALPSVQSAEENALDQISTQRGFVDFVRRAVGGRGTAKDDTASTDSEVEAEKGTRRGLFPRRKRG